MPMTMAQNIYGSLSVSGNAQPTVIDEIGVWKKLEIFDTAVSHGMTPSVEDSHLMVDQSGSFLIGFFACCRAFSANTAELCVWSNDRTRAHTAICAGPSQIEFAGASICDRIAKLGPAANLVTGDTLELWIRNTSHSSNFVFENLTFAALRWGA